MNQTFLRLIFLDCGFSKKVSFYCRKTISLHGSSFEISLTVPLITQFIPKLWTADWVHYIVISRYGGPRHQLVSKQWSVDWVYYIVISKYGGPGHQLVSKQWTMDQVHYIVISRYGGPGHQLISKCSGPWIGIIIL